MTTADRDTLRRLIAAALAAAAAVDALADEDEDDATRDALRPGVPREVLEAEVDVLVRLERLTRDELIRALARVVPADEPLAISLADGTLVVRTVDGDGVALIAPNRVHRWEGPP